MMVFTCKSVKSPESLSIKSCRASNLDSMNSLLHEGCKIEALRALIPPTVYVGPRTPRRQHVAPADGTNGCTSSSWVAVPTSMKKKDTCNTALLLMKKQLVWDTYLVDMREYHKCSPKKSDETYKQLTDDHRILGGVINNLERFSSKNNTLYVFHILQYSSCSC